MLLPMQPSPLYQALSRRQALGLPVFDLISSDFHAAGYMPDAKLLSMDAADYFRTRRYDPNPQGSLGARQALADYYRGRGNTETSASDFMLTSSSSEAYTLLFTQAARPGDRILLPLPGYPLFEDLASYAGLRTDFYPLDPAGGWQPELDILEALIQDRTRFLVLISPNNPTGSILEEDLVPRIVNICDTYGLAIIHDEVFAEYAGAGRDQTAALPDWGSIPSFTINGVSKICASPDLKLGWILFRKVPENLRESLEIVYDNYLNANSLSQFLLPGLLNQSLAPEGVTRKLGSRLKEHELILKDLLSRYGLKDMADRSGLGKDGPELGGIHRILLLPKNIDPQEDEQIAIRILEETGAFVHPGSLYGLDEEAGLVTSLLGGENWPEACEKLLSFLSGSV